MKIYTIIIITILFLSGCISLHNKERNIKSNYVSTKQFYIKKESIPLGCFYCLSVSNRISKNEYRLLQLPIQECYELEINKKE